MTMQYISVLEVIQSFIKHRGVWKSIQRKMQADSLKDPALLTSHADWTNCKNHAVFGHNQFALCLHFYIDEFEVCNPIGPHRNAHK